MRYRTSILALLLAALLSAAAAAPPPPANDTMHVPIGDITTIAGVRDNLLIGYGLVVGLNGTGDHLQTLFTTQTLSNILSKMGVQVPPQQMMVYNVAAVFVTATLPPFARPGMHIDVTVSATGDARSLQGGLLLLSALHGPDGQIYAEAQGALTVGGYTAGNMLSSIRVNQTNVGIVPNGGIVERDTSVSLSELQRLSLLLRDPNFVTAEAVATAINASVGSAPPAPATPAHNSGAAATAAAATPTTSTPAGPAHVIDSREIDVAWPSDKAAIPGFVARIEALTVPVTPPARVVVDERTGTIVIGSNVQLGPVSIMHGNLAIQVTTTLTASQPTPFSQGGQTAIVPNTTVKANESPAAKLTLQPGATVQDLVNGLQSIGASARDIVSILRAIKAAGALEAQLEVI